jgi:hypothetical protein
MSGRKKDGSDPKKAPTDDDGALRIRALGSGRKEFLQGIVTLLVRSELDINVDYVTDA